MSFRVLLCGILSELEKTHGQKANQFFASASVAPKVIGEQGFEKKNLLTPQSEADWKEWLAKENPDAMPEINVENHDTIGLLALDQDGNLSGACTTSGASYKLHGRVGDSPIIGSGLFIDNEIGGATATGYVA